MQKPKLSMEEEPNYPLEKKVKNSILGK